MNAAVRIRASASRRCAGGAETGRAASGCLGRTFPAFVAAGMTTHPFDTRRFVSFNHWWNHQECAGIPARETSSLTLRARRRT
jgi:hypothetical protein